MKKILTATILTFVALIATSAQSRITRTINEGWKFTKDGASTLVHLPHTWNSDDCRDDQPGYWRGECSYERELELGDEIDDRKVYIRFEGAFQKTKLYVNGSFAGDHSGGYTAFIFDVTGLVRKGKNDVRVIVDSSHDDDIPALSADYTFFGGIYRDVELVIVPQMMISPDVYASSGVLLSTPQLSEEKATVRATTFVTNATGKSRTLILEHRLIAPDGSIAVVSSQKLKLGKDALRQPLVQEFDLEAPMLWDIETPEVYTDFTSIYMLDGRERILVDQVVNPLGFRNFGFDKDRGFSINGRSLKIIGTNRHQDYSGLGNALNDEYHERDVRLLKEMGGNFLRIAHYPQDQVIVDECDRLGILNSIEIPIVNRVTMSTEFKRNCLEMAREMIYQGYNHPSTIIWAYMNEVLLGPPFKSKTTAKEKKEYYDFVCLIAEEIDDMVHELDPYRPTMIPCNCVPESYKSCGLGEIPDILGWNVYKGWYFGEFSDFGPVMDEIHAMFPDKPLIITEYGADNDPRIRSFDSERFDFSADYAVRYHQAYLKTIMDRPFIAGANVWNLADFYSEARKDAMPHINCKGLVSNDRVPKDSYWYYKAVLGRTPQLIISGRDWLVRGGDEDSYQTVDVYTNQPAVELFVNGVSAGVCQAEDGIASFSVRFMDGENILMAKSGDLTDILRISFHAIPSDMRHFSSLSVSMGRCFFNDKSSGTVWIPVKDYEPGSWGVVGGHEGRNKTRRGSQPRSNMDVLDSTDDMLFQTQYHGLEAFTVDVPDGQYYVYLYFCDLSGGEKAASLIYNLGNDAVSEDASDRVFSISANGVTLIPSLDISRTVGYCHPMIQRLSVYVSGGKGLTIGFHPIKGETSLSAIRVYRCH